MEKNGGGGVGTKSKMTKSKCGFNLENIKTILYRKKKWIFCCNIDKPKKPIKIQSL